MKRYAPLLKIGSGGTASVYVGTATGDLGFRQLVAIKRPHPHLADDATFRDALVQEAKIAARLRHANVVDVRDVEVDETGIQLVMDWVEGASLSDLIRSWTDAHASAAIRIVLDACEGLRAVHALSGDDGAPLDLVHRDVSPANVLVGLDGVARITDFGLAKPLALVERSTSEGTLRGKLGYMAPEYVRGKTIDARIDVFAMGVVTWEVLARARLFRGTNDAETLDRVQHAAPPALATVAPSLGDAAPALDVVIAQALAKDPEARFASVEAFAKELEAAARAHDLVGTHADVRASFGAPLRATIEDLRRRVHDASNEAPPSVVPSWSPPPLAQPTGDTATVVTATVIDDRPRSRTPFVVGAVVAVALATAIGIAFLSRDPEAARIREARAVASDLQTQDSAVRPHASDEAPAPPSPKPRPASGNKAPRPNPYTH